ncbi:polyphosphate polymerase domain-containing protein [Rheinheimera sp. UJ63]|uniref:polyphosphate polymerase domain-containing protein n=1 Tax=Rheinheimera sp. UJ63 TaxID=2910157 RepID=UPI001F162040|nr:polyphosphate polymerase domain-containing protein [Rheinheimera sp. UJ63]MCF4007875.1 polyphosphate polymerase domain-containing protein [Rheinheimera sp. UJ63]
MLSPSLFNQQRLAETPRQTPQLNKPQPVSQANPALMQALMLFRSHQLSDLDKATLMDRVDVKFMLPSAFLPSLLTQLQQHYSVLEIGGQRVSRYYNRYLDTAHFDFYYSHHNGKLNRFKVRQRSYLDTHSHFLEVKFKNNKKRTIKSRIPCADLLENQDITHAFMAKHMQTPLSSLQISQVSGYQRIALANEASAERLTLDFNLWFQADKTSQPLSLPQFFIAELKQFKRSKLSPFYQLMAKNHIYPVSFSKYCIGCALLYPNQLKTNAFKPTLTLIDKFAAIQSNTFNWVN